MVLKNRILTLELQKLRSSFLLLYPYPGFFLTAVLDQTVKIFFFFYSVLIDFATLVYNFLMHFFS
jgi:hypothetical protein